MKIHAYREMYVNRAQKVLGGAFDYAINVCGIKGFNFTQYFSCSKYSRGMEYGDPSVVAGRSGIELAMDVIYEATGVEVEPVSVERMIPTVEYWIGWAIAYYQWYSTRSFIEIFMAVPYDTLYRMYHPLHEADITKFVDIVDKKVREYYKETKIRKYRKIFGYTQSKLAELSGVTLRSIQMYEQRRKDINKASVETVYSLARVFGCMMEDLIEK